jgi:hypothetical protein
MPTRRDSLPKYRKHKASGQAVVELNGRVHYLGPLALKSLQRRMVESGQSRTYVNDKVDRLRRLFRWASMKNWRAP